MQTKFIDFLRMTSYAILVALFLLLYSNWTKEHPTQPVINTMPGIQMPSSSAAQNNYVPDVTNNATTANPTNVSSASAASTQLVHVQTDVMDVQIDPQGGNIVQVKFLKYPESLHSEKPFLLLNNNPDSRYVAQSGLLSANGPDTKQGQAVFKTDQNDYVLSPDKNTVSVNLHWQNAQGVAITKTFTFTKNSYQINVGYQIENKSASPWDGNLYLQLMRTNTPPTTKQGLVGMATYFGAAISSPDKPYQKISFKQMSQNNVNQSITGGWAAMIQHYFVSAWVPDSNATSQYFSRITNDGLYTVGMIGPKISVAPNQTFTTQAKFYAGPAISSELIKVAPHLNLTIDYGLLWFISAIIFWMMQTIFNFIGNWGWAIILTTLAIKLMFYHLSAKSYRSMSMLKTLQPKLNQLKERYGDDKQEFTKATMELYRKEKVNPMSGCLPMLIQIPVMMGLYWVLIQSVELRQAPFILWIHDLSIKDPYYVLPVLMGISMFLQQRLNPPPPDPMQAKVMMMMPVVFTVMFLNFPAGLMLYWFVNNTLSFLQQWYIMRSINADNSKKNKK